MDMIWSWLPVVIVGYWLMLPLPGDLILLGRAVVMLSLPGNLFLPGGDVSAEQFFVDRL